MTISQVFDNYLVKEFHILKVIDGLYPEVEKNLIEIEIQEKNNE